MSSREEAKPAPPSTAGDRQRDGARPDRPTRPGRWASALQILVRREEKWRAPLRGA